MTGRRCPTLIKMDVCTMRNIDYTGDMASHQDLRHDSCSLISPMGKASARNGSPAAIVSPPRRISTRPISLLSAAVSSGIVGARPVLPGDERSVSTTVAVTPFCSTLLYVNLR